MPLIYMLVDRTDLNLAVGDNMLLAFRFLRPVPV
jgi:hypothetical protein